jgi:hypothetical protein
MRGVLAGEFAGFCAGFDGCSCMLEGVYRNMQKTRLQKTHLNLPVHKSAVFKIPESRFPTMNISIVCKTSADHLLIQALPRVPKSPES